MQRILRNNLSEERCPHGRRVPGGGALFHTRENVKEEDIKASFHHGVLSLIVPKEEKAVPEKKTILIEG